jgi:hypothetical protein
MQYKLVAIVFFSIFISCKQNNPVTENDKPIEILNPIKDTLTVQTENKDSFSDKTINVPQTISEFIPKNYSVIDTTGGDLNMDKYRDMIVVIQKNSDPKKAKTEESILEKREVLLLIGLEKEGYKLEKKNENAIYNATNGYILSDPFTGITIKNGYFSIEHAVMGGQHWEQITTFKYNKTKSNWFLYKQGYVSYKLNDSDGKNGEEALVIDVQENKTVKNFGVIAFENFNINKI